MNTVRKRPMPVEMIIEPDAQASKPAAPRENRRQKWLIRIGVLFPLILLGFTLAHGAGENKNLPADILGVWQTSADQYPDCYLEITPATVMFGNVEHGYVLYFVSFVEENHEGRQATYVVHYTDLDGAKYEMTIYYTPQPHETVFFKNQEKVLWTRRPPV